jgi:hypothetical protein
MEDCCIFQGTVYTISQKMDLYCEIPSCKPHSPTDSHNVSGMHSYGNLLVYGCKKKTQFFTHYK